jgi:hypothetical protein
MAHKCIDCELEAPETSTDYTLISTQFGWRLQRRVLPAGTVVLEWRCPECWKRFKLRRDSDPLSGSDSNPRLPLDHGSQPGATSPAKPPSRPVPRAPIPGPRRISDPTPAIPFKPQKPSR